MEDFDLNHRRCYQSPRKIPFFVMCSLILHSFSANTVITCEISSLRRIFERGGRMTSPGTHTASTTLLVFLVGSLSASLVRYRTHRSGGALAWWDIVNMHTLAQLTPSKNRPASPCIIGSSFASTIESQIGNSGMADKRQRGHRPPRQQPLFLPAAF